MIWKTWINFQYSVLGIEKAGVLLVEYWSNKETLVQIYFHGFEYCYMMICAIWYSINEFVWLVLLRFILATKNMYYHMQIYYAHSNYKGMQWFYGEQTAQRRTALTTKMNQLSLGCMVLNFAVSSSNIMSDVTRVIFSDSSSFLSL